MSFAYRGFKYNCCDRRHEISYPTGYSLPGPWSPTQQCSEKMFTEHVDWVLSHSLEEIYIRET